MKVHRTFLAALALLLVIGLAAAGADGQGETAAAEKDEYLIYQVVHGGISHPFWKVCQRGAEEADAQLDDVKVVYTGPDVYGYEEFMTIVDSAIAAKPDGLIVTITSPDGMDETLRRVINDLKIPVIAINAKDPRPLGERIPYITYVGESSYDVGVAMARESLNRKKVKKAVFAHHAPGAIPIEERAAGYKDTLEAAGVEVDIVDIGADPVQGASILLDYLKANPDTELVYPASTPHIEAFIPLAEGEGFIAGKDIMIPSIDISPKVLEYIVNGKVMFTLDQQQYMQGYVSVMLMHLHLRYGLTPPALFPTGPGVITADVVPQLEKLSAAGVR
jgi:simple sugar transport system substrate-binding protein